MSPNVVVLPRIWEVLSSISPLRPANLTEVFCGFAKCLQANAMLEP
jgi:hypothetical protein